MVAPRFKNSNDFLPSPRLWVPAHEPVAMCLLGLAYMIEVSVHVMIEFLLDLSSYFSHFFDNRIFHARNSTIRSQPQQYAEMRLAHAWVQKPPYAS